MDLTKVLAQLRQELEYIDAAIISLERLQAKGARRGRPPKGLADLGKLKAAVRQQTPSPRQSQRGRR